jgi:hypothetical protein
MAATAVGYLYFSNLDISQQGGADTSASINGELAATTTEGANKGKGSLSSLLAMGESMEWTFVFSSNGVRGEGAGFYNNGNARIDSLYTGAESPLTASYIIADAKNKVAYNWTLDNSVLMGVKKALPDFMPDAETVSTEQREATPAVTEVVSLETTVEYDCKPWSVDNSVFVPPTDVTFRDMVGGQV